MAHIHQNLLPYRKGLFTSLLVFVFGVVGVLPVPSRVAADIFDAERLLGDSQKVAEYCHWQADVELFSSLQGKENSTLQMDVPCEQKVSLHETTKADAVHEDAELAATIRELTAGYPIEVMIPAIVKYDRAVAGLIVGIAKKESNWGKRVPLDGNGDDCFNYWGYKGAGSRGMAMGHGCFGSPEEAVTAVGDRLQKLVALRETSEPARMIVWKCGSSCKGHSDESVDKWVNDVNIYYKQIAKR